MPVAVSVVHACRPPARTGAPAPSLSHSPRRRYWYLASFDAPAEAATALT